MKVPTTASQISSPLNEGVRRPTRGTRCCRYWALCQKYSKADTTHLITASRLRAYIPRPQEGASLDLGHGPPCTFCIPPVERCKTIACPRGSPTGPCSGGLLPSERSISPCTSQSTRRQGLW